VSVRGLKSSFSVLFPSLLAALLAEASCESPEIIGLPVDGSLSGMLVESYFNFSFSL
jgi:hypothetical protein